MIESAGRIASRKIEDVDLAMPSGLSRLVALGFHVDAQRNKHARPTRKPSSKLQAAKQTRIRTTKRKPEDTRQSPENVSPNPTLLHRARMHDMHPCLGLLFPAKFGDSIADTKDTEVKYV